MSSCDGQTLFSDGATVLDYLSWSLDDRGTTTSRSTTWI